MEKEIKVICNKAEQCKMGKSKHYLCARPHTYNEAICGNGLDLDNCPEELREGRKCVPVEEAPAQADPMCDSEAQPNTDAAAYTARLPKIVIRDSAPCTNCNCAHWTRHEPRNCGLTATYNAALSPDNCKHFQKGGVVPLKGVPYPYFIEATTIKKHEIRWGKDRQRGFDLDILPGYCSICDGPQPIVAFNPMSGNDLIKVCPKCLVEVLRAADLIDKSPELVDLGLQRARELQENLRRYNVENQSLMARQKALVFAVYELERMVFKKGRPAIYPSRPKWLDQREGVDSEKGNL